MGVVPEATDSRHGRLVERSRDKLIASPGALLVLLSETEVLQ